VTRKIIVLIGDVLIALIAGVLIFGFAGSFSTSLNVTCDLQNDGTYICQARDILLNWAVSEKRAEHVASLEQRLKCSGSGNNKGCSHISEFVTITGERIQLSRLFTASESRVTKLVKTINDMMQTKSTPINYTSDFSPWLIFNVCLSSSLFIMLLLRAFLRPSLKNKNEQSS
jgi:hypothetical protein